MPELTLEIVIGEKRWQTIPGLQARMRKVATSAFAALPSTLQSPSQVTVLLTNNAEMKRLNRDFRGLNRPTNVLSFPQYTPRQLTKKGKAMSDTYKGDVALAYQYMVAEAKNDHNILINHLSHLLIHGLLHIFGYDHQSQNGTIRMERLEQKIMAGLGLPDPYAPQPRSQRPAK